jgi:hypothetical protein
LIDPSKAVKIKNPLTKDLALSRATLTRLNVERFQGTLSYFSQLNATGEISDRAYEALVRYACAIFLQTEIEEIVHHTLEQKLEQFLIRKIFRDDNGLFEAQAGSLNVELSQLLQRK